MLPFGPDVSLVCQLLFWRVQVTKSGRKKQGYFYFSCRNKLYRDMVSVSLCELETVG